MSTDGHGAAHDDHAAVDEGIILCLVLLIYAISAHFIEVKKVNDTCLILF
jgi:hypothetical protein